MMLIQTLSNYILVNKNNALYFEKTINQFIAIIIHINNGN